MNYNFHWNILLMYFKNMPNWLCKSFLFLIAPTGYTGIWSIHLEVGNMSGSGFKTAERFESAGGQLLSVVRPHSPLYRCFQLFHSLSVSPSLRLAWYELETCLSQPWALFCSPPFCVIWIGALLRVRGENVWKKKRAKGWFCLITSNITRPKL